MSTDLAWSVPAKVSVCCAGGQFRHARHLLLRPSECCCSRAAELRHYVTIRQATVDEHSLLELARRSRAVFVARGADLGWGFEHFPMGCCTNASVVLGNHLAALV